MTTSTAIKFQINTTTRLSVATILDGKYTSKSAIIERRVGNRWVLDAAETAVEVRAKNADWKGAYSLPEYRLSDGAAALVAAEFAKTGQEMPVRFFRDNADI